MSRWPVLPLKGHISEVSLRKGETDAEVLSVTNTNGFVRSLDVFDKQVFSQDTSNYKLVRFNDIAYNPSRINVGSVARCHLQDGGAISPMYVVISCGQSLLPQYLLYFLKSEIGLQHINHRCVGAVRFQLRYSDLEQIEMPIPPLAAQERIVRILDEAEELRNLKADADQRTDELIPALFHDMFGDPVKNKKGWMISSLGESILFITSGSRGWAEYYSERGAKFIRVQNLTGNKLNFKDIAFVTPPDNAEAKRTRVHWNDLLITITGVVGLVAVAPCDLGESYVSQHVSIIRLSDKLNPAFAQAFLAAESGGQRQIAEMQYGQTKPGLSLNQIRSIKIFLPPLTLQQEFAARVTEIDELVAEQSTNRQRLGDLFQSLLHRAFQGAL